MALIGLLYFVIAAATIIFAYIKYAYSYWDRKGFQTAPGVSYAFGHFKATFLQTKSIGDVLQEFYDKSTEPFIGIYGILRPMIVLNDPEVVRNVLIKDFSNFTDRGVYSHERDALSGHLFALPGEKWKNLRSKLSPTFTSGKLKSMFSTLVNCGLTVENYLEKAAKTNELIDIRELSASMTTNVISSVAFGIEVDSINNPSTSFRKFGRQIFAPSLKNGIRGLINFTSPKLMAYMPFKSVDREVEDFIFSVVEENLKHREENNVTRKDFFQLLVQLRNKGSVELDDQWETVIKTDGKKLSVEEIAAQVFVFFAAGFETSSSTISFCLYELAKNPEIQKRVQEDIDKVLEKHNGQITYESVTEMEYLECCIDETLRKYPVLPVLNRSTMNDYQIPGTKQVIEKGVEIFIPIMSMQRDEKYYPNPMKFDPERFNKVNSAGKNQVTQPYMPFGDGPRNCIGMRLGKMQTKVGLLLMMKQFKFDFDENQRDAEIVFDASSLLLAPKGGIKLRASKRK